MALSLYNSLTRKKEEFIPRDEGKVGIYVCGPTVYGFVHVGNARPYVFFLVFERYLRHLGFEVTLVENLTDVDDKIIVRAADEGTTAEAIAKTYSDAYIEDTGRLGLGRPDIEPRATGHIGEIIDLCRQLVDEGMAYDTGGSVYFRVERFPGYGKLSGQKTDQMRHQEPPREGEAKESPLDFAIWKAAKPGEPSWESPWGPGRPGWHIECTAMSGKYLGESFDIHGGGRDLVFPHHENEVAQAEAASGKEFARFWMHNGMITRKEAKMSKSIGNIFTLREFLKQYDPRVLIIFFISSHYRSPIEFSTSNLAESQAQLDRLKNCFWKMASVSVDMGAAAEAGEPRQEAQRTREEAQRARQEAQRTREESATGAQKGEAVIGVTPDDTALGAAIGRADANFHDEMQDDVNTAGALGAVFGLVRAINEYTEAVSVCGQADTVLLGDARKLLTELLYILGLEISEADYTGPGLEPALQELVGIRENARKKGDYNAADAARDQLAAAGYEVRDTPQGPKLVRKS